MHEWFDLAGGEGPFTYRSFSILTLENQMSEIQKVLANEITPTLERLRSEKKHYLKWSANNTEIEKLQRLCVAFQFSRAVEEVEKSADELKQMEDERERCVGFSLG